MTAKKVVKSQKVSKNPQKTVLANNKHFLAVLVLFVGFSSYAILSFMSSNNDYIKKLLTDVTSSDVVTEGPEIPRENPFVDLPADHINYDAVIALYYEGIVSGYSDGTFKPDKKVNRAEFAKMLVEAGDLDYTDMPAADLSNCFGDVKDLPGDWFAPSVCAAKYKGWVNGYESGNYAPSQNINKAEGVKIVLKAFGFTIPANESVAELPYSDVGLTDWYLGVAQAAKQYALVSKGDVFMAGWELTRGDVSQVIFNAMKAKGSV